MSENKKPEIIFMPGCFDNFEGTQEELDEMMKEIQALVDSGELFSRAVPISVEELSELGLPYSLDDFADGKVEDLTNIRNRKLQ